MNEMMNAVVFKAIGQFELTQKPIPKIKNPGDLLVKIEVCSICGSDLHILSDPPAIPAEIGVILGHEFAGTVIEVGKDVKTFKIGDKISCDPNISCGICPLCQLGQPNLCLNVKCLGVDLDGGFAQYVVLPEHMAVKLDDNMDWETAVFIEPLNCVMGAMDKITAVTRGNSACIRSRANWSLLYRALES